jgi:hypothetical protein
MREGDVIAYALAEDGTCLAQHLSSSAGFAHHDIGMSSEWKHDIYRKHYPDGFHLVWIEPEDVAAHKGWQEAMKRNQEMAAKEDKPC